MVKTLPLVCPQREGNETLPLEQRQGFAITEVEPCVGLGPGVPQLPPTAGSVPFLCC